MGLFASGVVSFLSGNPTFLVSPRRGRRFCAAIAGLLLSAGSLTALAQVAAQYRTAPRSLITESLDRNQRVSTTGALSRTAFQHPDLGEAPSSMPIEHIQLLLQRPAERQAALDAFVEAQHTTRSASYHKWLTPEQVGSEFGPSASDLATIKGFLESEGFTVNTIGKGGYYIDFTGTVAQVEHTFQTQIHLFKMPTGETRFASVLQASIPRALAPAVAGFVSLSSIHTAVMNHVKGPADAFIHNQGAVPDSKSSSTPQDTGTGGSYYAVGPQDFYTIYNENPALTSGTTGAGVTIALLEETNINTADVTTFRTTYGVTPATPTSLVVEHGYLSNTCTNPGISSKDEESEAVLDTEWAGAVAPGANLLFMSCKVGTNLGVVYSAQAVIDNNLADVMSLSYGDYEGDTLYGNVDGLINNLWQQATSQGETVVVSSGDSGAALDDYLNGDNWAEAGGPTVNLYASTAYNVSAGGTDFSDTYNGDMGSPFGNTFYWNATDASGKSSAKSYIPESPWDNTCASAIYNAYKSGLTAPPQQYCGTLSATSNDVDLTAGGGGPSQEHARPTWQAAGAVAGIPAATGTNAFRLQPDISLFASNGVSSTGYNGNTTTTTIWNHFLEAYQSDTGGLFGAGGTSFVAPQLAGLFALIKQSTGERLGQPNYVLYNIAANLYGATTPTNACNGSGATGVGVTTTAPASSCILYDIQVGSSDVPCGAANGNAAGTHYDCDRTDATVKFGILDNTGADILGGSSTAVEAYNTGAGYDMATGLGSVNISNLVSNWPAAANLYTPTVALTDSSSTVVYGSSEIITATVSGSGSYPTGSVLFTYTGPSSGTAGTATIAGNNACSTGGTCVESAAQTIYPAVTASPTPYVFTGTYNSTNENYTPTTSSNTVSVTVTKQTPVFAVQNVTIAVGTATATLTATLTYTGTGASLGPTGTAPFTVTGGSGTFTGNCAQTSSTVSTCTVSYPTSTLAVNNYTISATYSGDANYNAITTAATGTLKVVSANPPTITFSVVSPQYTMYPTVALAATSNSSGTFAYSITATTGTATGSIAGSTLTLTGGAGTITVLASQAAAGMYTAGSGSSTSTVKAGSVWVANSTGDVSTFDLSTGVVLTPSPGLKGAGVGTVAFPIGDAFDAAGNLWIASSTGVSEFLPGASGPVAVSATPITAGGIKFPLGIAVDGLSNIWVANDNGTISGLTDAGAAITPGTGYTASGVAAEYSNFGGIAVDLSGNIWVTNTKDGSVTQVIGVAAPVAPLSTSLANGTTGTRP